MRKLNRALAVFAITGASVATWEGGSVLVENVQFARAEQKVDSTREQLQNVEDLSTVFRNVAKVINPSVVQIQVRKTVKGARQMPGGPGDDFLRRFFQQHEDQGGGQGQATPNDQNDQGDNNDNQTPDDDSQDLQEVGTGSGVIMEVDGSDAYIITNNHVAGGATDLTVTLADGRQIKGTTLGADAKSDLAVVKISADHLIPAHWGDSDQLEQGDWVLAFGSPFGYVGSMTHGIVSALNRDTREILGSMGYEHFIQVDAPINPGNSGGPLVNMHGEVIGINTAIATRSGGFQGIGFAIPSAEAKKITAVLKEKGKITRGWLGVGIADVNQLKPAEVNQLGYTSANGVFVEEVRRDTPSYGKLQPGDIITGINGKSVANSWELRNEIADTTPGTTLKLQVFRDHKQHDIAITIGTQPEDLEALASGHHDGSSPRAGNAQAGQALGMRLSNLTDELAQKNDLGDAHDGALVTAVKPGSLADMAGLKPGDLITAVNGENVSNVDQATDVLSKQDASKGITFNVTNREGSSSLFLQKQ